MKLRIASRKSLLSIKQVELVVDALKKRYPDIEIEVKFYKTKGDIYRDLPPYKIGSKGIFEKEVNKAVLSGEADIAVHSLKDVPSETYEELRLAAVLPRESPLESLVSRDGLSIYKLKPGSIIGTSSIRRKAAITYLRRDVIVRQLRGNVDTRIRKLMDGMYDAIILAEAGLRRLGYSDSLKRYIFNPYEITPAPCQGIIGVYVHREDREINKIISSINDLDTYLEAYIERGIMKRVGGGCHLPLGIYASKIRDSIFVISALYSPDGRERILIEDVGRASEPDKVIDRVSQELLRLGRHIIEEVK